MDRKFLRSLCATLSLLIVAVLFLFPVDHKRLIDPWRESMQSLLAEQDHALHASTSVHCPTENISSSPASSPMSTQGISSKERSLKIAITESMGWHDEVYAALVHAFGSQPDTHLSLFFKNPRWSMPELLKTFQLNASLPGYVYHNTNALDVAEPDIIVSTTCEYDNQNLNERLDLLFERRKTYLFCIAHYAFPWDHRYEWEPNLNKWMEAGLMTILTLSPHIQKAFHEPGWGLNERDSLRKPSTAAQGGLEDEQSSTADTAIPWPPIEVFVPVFPVPDLTKEGTGSEIGQRTKEEVAFAIQGGINAARDYTRIISYLEDLFDSNSTSHAHNDVSLHIIGSGSEEDKPTLPASVSDHVFFDQDLDYLEYYKYLSEKSALIPAFAEDAFLNFKASSSVPASVIAGIPLVATREILRSYSYLTAEDVYLQGDHETELDVIKRVIKGSNQERRLKIKKVGEMRDRMIKNNVKAVGGWIEEARAKIER